MRSRVTAVVWLSLLCTLVLAAPAHAAFPGENGKIVFSSFRSGNSDIYTINPDGSGLTQLTNDPAPEVDPAWSPDGKQIAFSRKLPNAADEINVMDADGSNRRLVYDQTEYPARPAWSPDGTEIAMYGIYRIRAIHAEGECFCRVPVTDTDYRYGNRDPAWSPDGSRIAFAQYNYLSSSSNYDIHLVDPDGSNQVNLTATPGTYETTSNWSPDGRFLAISSDFGGGVRVIGVDGSNLTTIPGTAADREAAYSPDGTRIVATTWIPETRHPQLVTYRLDGSGRELIPGTESASNGGPFQGPDWQPVFGPKRSDYKNAAQFCEAEREFFGDEAFRQRYGGGANAFGKCVSGN